MTGLGVTVFTDEHVHAGLANALRQRGYDALSCQEAGLAGRGVSDAAQLEYAARQGRAVLTYDVVDFIQLDHEWKEAGRRHAGIILVPSRINTFGELLRRVLQHLDTTDPQTQHNALLWLA